VTRRRADAALSQRWSRPFLAGPRLWGLALLAVGGLFLWWRGGADSSAPPRPAAAVASETRQEQAEPRHGRLEVSRLEVRVRGEFPHARDAYTQGLLWHQGKLYESTGQYGQSSLRRVDLASGVVEQRWDLPDDLFAEGLARVGDRLIQLTWHAGLAKVYSRQDFTPVGEYSYLGEGWGLCHDGARLVMSDGSDRLSFRDPKTFAVLGEIRVTLRGRPLSRLNELECVEGAVWANVWTTDLIVRIDPDSGQVTATVDASGLLSPEESRNTEVLNGIAYRTEKGTFLLTGKYWPKLFEVEFVAVRDSA